MKRAFYCIELGLTNLGDYGPHPGTGWLVFFVLVGTLAGGWRGGLFLFACFGPLYLVGAYGRGADYLRSVNTASREEHQP